MVRESIGVAACVFIHNRTLHTLFTHGSTELYIYYWYSCTTD